MRILKLFLIFHYFLGYIGNKWLGFVVERCQKTGCRIVEKFEVQTRRSLYKFWIFKQKKMQEKDPLSKLQVAWDRDLANIQFIWGSRFWMLSWLQCALSFPVSFNSSVECLKFSAKSELYLFCYHFHLFFNALAQWV